MKRLWIIVLLLWVAIARADTTLFTDDFNRGDGAIGDGWVDIPGRSCPGIVSNQIQTDSPAFDWGCYNTATLPDDQWAQMKITALPLDGNEVRVIVRESTTEHTGYSAAINNSGGTYNLRLIKWTNGTYNLLNETSVSVSAGDTLKAQIQGNVLTGYIGASNLTTTDPDIPTGIYAGFEMATFAGTSGPTADDFACGDLVAVGGGPIRHRVVSVE